MTAVLSLLVGGLGHGAVIAMVAVGIVLIFRATGIVNFAQGELLMLGAYAYVTAATVVGAGSALGVFIEWLSAAGVGALAGALLFLLVHKVVRRDDELGIIIVTLGLQVLIQAAMRTGFSDIPRGGKAAFLGDVTFYILGAPISGNTVIIFGATLALAGALLALFRFTTIGKAMLAVAENKGQAALFGIPVNLVLCGSCALAGAIAGIGGLLLSPITDVFPQMGLDVVLPAFVGAVVGGFSNVWGALIGGLLVGVLQTFSAAYLGGTMRDVSTFAILIAIMIFRPAGLFAEIETRKA